LDEIEKVDVEDDDGWAGFGGMEDNEGEKRDVESDLCGKEEVDREFGEREGKDVVGGKCEQKDFCKNE
jgi:hypothetical protein